MSTEHGTHLAALLRERASRLYPGNGVYTQVVVREEDWRDVLAVVEAVQAAGPWLLVDSANHCIGCGHWQAPFADRDEPFHDDDCWANRIADALRRLEREVGE